MSELQDLYQEVILDHNKRPRNFRALDKGQKAEGYNPLCGDRVTVFLEEEGGIIKDVSFQGAGCAISTASASMMTERLKGVSVEEAETLFEQFHRMATGKEDEGDVAGREGDGGFAGKDGGGRGDASGDAGRAAGKDDGGTERTTETREYPLRKLEVFSNISEYPMRVKCASLAWHTLKAALKGSEEPVVTTEQ